MYYDVGHQFGHFVPQLGNGRAVIRSSIREYLVSEVMFVLGVYTAPYSSHYRFATSCTPRRLRKKAYCTQNIMLMDTLWNL